MACSGQRVCCRRSQIHGSRRRKVPEFHCHRLAKEVTHFYPENMNSTPSGRQRSCQMGYCIFSFFQAAVPAPAAALDRCVNICGLNTHRPGHGCRLYCRLTSFSQSLQTNLRITLDDTLLNGWLIGRCSRICEKIFDFQDRLSLRKFFA